jgi:hypothetical protein
VLGVSQLFQWSAESEIERPGFYRGFHAVGKALADVQGFAALVRLVTRTGSLEHFPALSSDSQPLGHRCHFASDSEEVYN